MNSVVVWGGYQFVLGYGVDDLDLVFVRDNLDLFRFGLAFQSVINLFGDVICFEMLVGDRIYSFRGHVDSDVVEVVTRLA